MKSFTKNSAGAFTLIEMLIVVVIIGLLVGIGVPALKNAKTDAKAAKVATALAQVATAKTRYLLDNDTTGTVTIAENALYPYLLVNGAAITNINNLLGAGIANTIVIGDSATSPSIQ